MRSLLFPVLRTLAFLTRLPPAAFAFGGAERPLGRDAPAFPVAGLVAALPGALLLWLAGALGLSPLLAATVATVATITVTGALHEDGLGDVADGLGGHHPRERALAIMKDSRVGTYGALALVSAVALRVVLLAELFAAAPGLAILSLLGAAAASRGAMALLWAALPSADPGGLADRMGRPSLSAGIGAALLGAGLLLLPAALAGAMAGASLGLALAGLAFVLFARFLRRRLGGQTGDCLGAAQQITEIALLLGLAIAP